MLTAVEYTVYHAGGTCVVGNDHRAAISASMQLQFRTDAFAKILQYNLLHEDYCKHMDVRPQTGHQSAISQHCTRTLSHGIWHLATRQHHVALQCWQCLRSTQYGSMLAQEQTTITWHISPQNCIVAYQNGSNCSITKCDSLQNSISAYQHISKRTIQSAITLNKLPPEAQLHTGSSKFLRCVLHYQHGSNCSITQYNSLQNSISR